MMVFEYALFLLLFAWLARWVVSGWGGREGARLDPGHTAELARLREDVDQLTAQLLRVQEEQSFTMRLLAERGGAAAPALPAGEADPTTHTEKP